MERLPETFDELYHFFCQKSVRDLQAKSRRASARLRSEKVCQSSHGTIRSYIIYLELNYIEMVWGWAKSYHGRTCTYNYKALKDELPTTLLETCPVACFRRFLIYCLRFMSGYREGLEGSLLDYTMKKYRSHRCVPTGLKTLL